MGMPQLGQGCSTQLARAAMTTPVTTANRLPSAEALRRTDRKASGVLARARRVSKAPTSAGRISKAPTSARRMATPKPSYRRGSSARLTGRPMLADVARGTSRASAVWTPFEAREFQLSDVPRGREPGGSATSRRPFRPRCARRKYSARPCSAPLQRFSKYRRGDDQRHPANTAAILLRSRYVCRRLGVMVSRRAGGVTWPTRSSWTG